MEAKKIMHTQGEAEEVTRRINKFSRLQTLECEAEKVALLELQILRFFAFSFLSFSFRAFPFTSSSSVIYKIATFKSCLQTFDFMLLLLLLFFISFFAE